MMTNNSSEVFGKIEINNTKMTSGSIQFHKMPELAKVQTTFTMNTGARK